MRLGAKLAVSALIISAIPAWIYFCTVMQSRRDEADAAQKTLRAFCVSTKNSVHADLSALRSDSRDAQHGAIRRITDDRIYFGDSSARICLGARMPDASSWSACLFTEDIPCVLERTERLYKLLEQP